MTPVVDRAAGTCRVEGVVYRVVAATRPGRWLVCVTGAKRRVVGAFDAAGVSRPATRAVRWTRDVREYTALCAIQRAWLADDAARAGE